MAVRRVARLLGTVLADGLVTAGAGVHPSSTQALASAASCTPSAPVVATLFPRRAWLSQVAQQAVQAPQYTYQLAITTGNLRGAGTVTPAIVQLLGSNGKSERIIVGDDDDGLVRGSTRIVTVTTHEDLGQIRLVNVQRLATSITDAGTGWFLQDVLVSTPEQQQIMFPCNAWFGESEGGGHPGPLERNLLPMGPEDMIQGEPVRVSASGLAVPHPDKVRNDGIKGVNKKGFGHGGEDAYFYCKGTNEVFALGVADGVYMWRESGIDSGMFSRTLMKLSEQHVKNGMQDVVKVMEMSAHEVHKQGVKGSSTVCVALIDQKAGRLHAANLGDSGFLLLRCPTRAAPAGVGSGGGSEAGEPGLATEAAESGAGAGRVGRRHHHMPSPAISLPLTPPPGGGTEASAPARRPLAAGSFALGLDGSSGSPFAAVPGGAPPGGAPPSPGYAVKFRTNQLEHDFGRPFQLGHHQHADTADKCDVASIAVLRGDVIVMGSDGLLDNLSDGEIAAEVSAQRAKAAAPSVIAQRLAKLAFEAAYDKGRITPYALAASEHFDMAYSGGKPDDITVLVALLD